MIHPGQIAGTRPQKTETNQQTDRDEIDRAFFCSVFFKFIVIFLLSFLYYLYYSILSNIFYALFSKKVQKKSNFYTKNILIENKKEEKRSSVITRYESIL